MAVGDEGRQALLLHGAAGIGKSTIVHTVAVDILFLSRKYAVPKSFLLGIIDHERRLFTIER
jgi:predicted ATPase